MTLQSNTIFLRYANLDCFVCLLHFHENCLSVRQMTMSTLICFTQQRYIFFFLNRQMLSGWWLFTVSCDWDTPYSLYIMCVDWISQPKTVDNVKTNVFGCFSVLQETSLVQFYWTIVIPCQFAKITWLFRSIEIFICVVRNYQIYQ